jgi:hypothetical protein
MDVEAYINTIPKPVIVLCLLAFFMLKVLRSVSLLSPLLSHIPYITHPTVFSVLKVLWSTVGAGVKTITSVEEWKEVIQEAGEERLVVVYCHSGMSYVICHM